MNAPRAAAMQVGFALVVVTSLAPIASAFDGMRRLPDPIMQDSPRDQDASRIVLFESAPAPSEADDPSPEATGSLEPSASAAPVSAPWKDIEPGAPLAEPEPKTTGALDLAPPDLPDVVVTITASDQATSALAGRLADARHVLHPRLVRKEREAIAAFYALGDFRPIWIKDGVWTAAAKKLIGRLRIAHEDGLDPAEYPIPALGVTKAGDSSADLADAELKLSVSASLYARDARGGRIDPARLSGLITPKLELPTADAVLTRLAATSDPGAALAGYNPAHPGYQALKAKLAELRASRPGPPMVRLPQGPALRVGMRDPRVPLIRARFNLGPPRDETAYDDRVASAVAAFQREKGMPATSGVLTNQTVAALSGGSPARVEGDLVANMERWRWLPSDLGPRHILVNVPEFRLRVFDGGAVAHQARVIVGKPQTPTPIFSGIMEYAIVNPAWNVPPSILKNEFLPGMAADPFYAEKRGYQVIRKGNQISVRQPPGERNALGFIKFMFPNQHAVYLHDTPSRGLFASERRAFSHGCVRVDQPFRLAEVILGQSWSAERMRRLIGQGERTIHLPQRLPVHLTYFTTSVDERGEVHQIDDLYGYHRRVRAALGFAG